MNEIQNFYQHIFEITWAATAAIIEKHVQPSVVLKAEYVKLLMNERERLRGLKLKRRTPCVLNSTTKFPTE